MPRVTLLLALILACRSPQEAPRPCGDCQSGPTPPPAIRRSRSRHTRCRRGRKSWSSACSTAPDRSALRRLLVESAELPHPRAVELGLVDPARPVVAPDPRVEPSDAVVFYWVPPANP